MGFVSKEVLASLSVRIGADTAGFTKGLKTAKGNMNILKQGASQLGVAMAAALSISAIKSFIAKSTELYDIQQKSEAKLLKALGDRQDSYDRLTRQASNLQSKTLFGDEETIEAQSRLAMILGDNEEAIRTLTPLVQDLAAAKDMQLASAADLVAKSVGSSTNSMSRYGIVIEGTVGSAERLESAVKSLNEQVGGQAQAAAEAGMGTLGQLGNDWGDMMEVAGKLIAPSINETAKEWRDELRLLQDESMGFWEKMWIGISDERTAVYNLNREMEDHLQLIEDVNNTSSGTSDIIEVKIPLLEQQNELLKEARKRQKEALTEQDLQKANREIQLIEEKITKLKELGKIPVAPEIPDMSVSVEDASLDLNEVVEDKIDWGDLLNDDGDLDASFDAMVEKFGEFGKDLDTEVKKINSIIESGIEGMVEGLGEGLGKLIATGDMDASYLLEPFASMLIQLGELAIATGIGIAGIKKAFSSLNPAVAIAAGVALIALGSAISSAISNIGTSSSSSVSTSLTSGSGVDHTLSSGVGTRADSAASSIEVSGVLKGSSIYLANKRYQSSKNIST